MGILLQERFGALTIALRTGGDKTLQGRELILGSMGKKPCRNLTVTLQLGQRVGRTTVGPAPVDISTLLHEQLDHFNVPALRCDVQWRLVQLSPGEVDVRAVVQQPTYARSAGQRARCPSHGETQRRNPSRYAVDVDSESM